MVIEKGVHADIDELARLYDDLNDFLDSDINHPGWIKGVYPVRQIAETGINEQNLYVVRLEGRIIGSIILNHHSEPAYKKALWGDRIGLQQNIRDSHTRGSSRFPKSGGREKTDLFCL